MPRKNFKITEWKHEGFTEILDSGPVQGYVQGLADAVYNFAESVQEGFGISTSKEISIGSYVRNGARIFAVTGAAEIQNRRKKILMNAIGYIHGR